MDPIVVNALMAVEGMQYFQNIVGHQMPWVFEPRLLNEQQRAHIQMSMDRCDDIYHRIMARAGYPAELENSAIDALNNATNQLESVENEDQFLAICHIVHGELNYWEAKMLLGNENMQFFDDDLDNNGEPWTRRRDRRRG